ncbi:hypothetical protein H3Z83_08295 [Tenacibaculum sp. S7007]|uniref:Uncharacterized protein n=1 Tax=Tenacibaculum pelagium TaxID=2759527 RepID=A0A839AQK0_9FLAO|nr:hypothetical protein [Tenacibaculum pelagium]MBA6156509.1 hypothetical protein [Tenacibaculum pelagium]
MKIDILNIIKTGDISPFKWGDSESDILKIFPEWKETIAELKKAKFPYIEIDSVEFYFDTNYYKGLSEIIIKVLNFDNDYKSDFFDFGWLNDSLNFKSVTEKLNNLNWRFELTKGPNFKTPIILPNRNVFFSFEQDYSGDNEENDLLKIYINRTEYTTEYLNKGKHKITLYNTV